MIFLSGRIRVGRRLFQALAFLPLGVLLGQDTEGRPKNEGFEEGLRALIVAIEQRDFEAVAAKLPPSYVEKVGGAAAAVRLLESVDAEARAAGFDVSKVTVHDGRDSRKETRSVTQAGKTTATSVEVCVAPTSVVVKNGAVTKTLHSSVVGLREGADGKWHFLEGVPAIRTYLAERFQFEADILPPQKVFEEGPGDKRRYWLRGKRGLEEIDEIAFLFGKARYANLGTFDGKRESFVAVRAGRRFEESRMIYVPKNATRRLPAESGQTFGYSISFSHALLDREVSLEGRISHPEYTEPDGVKNREIKNRVSRAPRSTSVSLGNLFSFTDDAPYEIKPGEWLFEHYAGGKRVFAVSFDVTSPQDPKPDEGQWKGNEYYNPFFGLRFHAPEKWKPVSDAEEAQLATGVERLRKQGEESEENPMMKIFQVAERGAGSAWTGRMAEVTAR
jgi:hypothetical protein